MTGGALLAAVNIALTKRAKTGEGQHVHTSLLHTGIFCLSHTLATTATTAVPSYVKQSRRLPTSTSYRTRDAKRVVILGGGAPAEHWLRILARGLQNPLLLEIEQQPAESEAWLRALDSVFGAMDLDALCNQLEELGVPHCVQPSVPEMAIPAGDGRVLVGDGPTGARCYTSGLAIGVPGMSLCLVCTFLLPVVQSDY